MMKFMMYNFVAFSGEICGNFCELWEILRNIFNVSGVAHEQTHTNSMMGDENAKENRVNCCVFLEGRKLSRHIYQ